VPTCPVFAGQVTYAAIYYKVTYSIDACIAIIVVNHMSVCFSKLFSMNIHGHEENKVNFVTQQDLLLIVCSVYNANNF